MRYGVVKTLACLVVICFTCYLLNYELIVEKADRKALSKMKVNHSKILKLGKKYKTRKLPGCLLIGVRKGGTRALIDMMRLHTRIKSASTEVHFFDVDGNFKKGYDWYKSQMPLARPHDIILEKSPSYFVTDAAPARVHAMNKSIQLLLIVRDPVTRLISDYTQILHNHLEKGMYLKPLEELALDSDGSINTSYDALNRSLYYHHMKMWLKYFPLSQIHIVNGDRLIKKPWHEVLRVEKFLGVDHQISRNHFYFNATKGFHCIRQAAEEKCLAKSKGRPHPNISTNIVHKLRKFFRPFNYKFYNLVGEDFGWPDD